MHSPTIPTVIDNTRGEQEPIEENYPQRTCESRWKTKAGVVDSGTPVPDSEQLLLVTNGLGVLRSTAGVG